MQTVRTGAVVGGSLSTSTLAEFLKSLVDDDRQFLAEEELNRFPAAACGMANGPGGWIVLGASMDLETGELLTQGVSDPVSLKARLAFSLSNDLSVRLSAEWHILKDPVPLVLVHVLPAGWNERPVFVRQSGAACRRVEGVDLVCSTGMRCRLGLDALERLRDDEPVRNMSPSELDRESVAGFREALVLRRPEWKNLSEPRLLSRARVLSGGQVTKAGSCLLGRTGPGVRAELRAAPEGKSVVLEVRNLWRAYSDMLPRLTRSLSPLCSAAFRECFINALLHSDYDAGGVTALVTGGPATVRIENFGTIRTWRTGESVCRNFRLMKIFQALGAARGDGKGLGVIRSYLPGFRLEQGMLDLTTVAELPLEPMAELCSVHEEEGKKRGKDFGGALSLLRPL